MNKMAFKNIGLFAIVIMLSGCVVQNLLYKKIDWLAVRQFNETFELTDAQADVFEPQIRNWVNDVKKPVFKAVVQGFTKASEQANQGFIKNGLVDLEKSLLEARKIFMLPGIAIASKFLKSLSDEQIASFQKKMRERENLFTEILEADADEFLDLKADRVEEIADRLESWIGPMTKYQLELTAEFWWKDKASIALRLKRRHALQDKFIAIVKSYDEKKLADFFRRWGDDIDYLTKLTFPDEKIRIFSMRTYLSSIVESLTPDQKKILQKKLLEFSKDLSGVLN